MSNDAELLILVDAKDNETGTLDKAACHDGDGILHRAFSLFIFNAVGDLLVQRRAANKRLWPGFWSNSCCSHPRAGESMDLAVQRRCQEELGFVVPLTYLYKFEYSANYEKLGAEHELCSVYTGTYLEEPRINTTEISEYRWLPRAQISGELEDNASAYTPWFKLEWQRLEQEFQTQLP